MTAVSLQVFHLVGSPVTANDLRINPNSGKSILPSNHARGAVLQLSGRQTGLMVNADLSGLAISLR